MNLEMRKVTKTHPGMRKVSKPQTYESQGVAKYGRENITEVGNKKNSHKYSVKINEGNEVNQAIYKVQEYDNVLRYREKQYKEDHKKVYKMHNTFAPENIVTTQECHYKSYLDSGNENGYDIVVLKGNKITIKNQPLVSKTEILIEKTVIFKPIKFIAEINYLHFSKKCNISNERNYKKDGLFFIKESTFNQELQYNKNERKLDYDIIEIHGKFIRTRNGSLSTIWKNGDNYRNYPIQNESSCCEEDDSDILKLKEMITCLEEYHSRLNEKKEMIKETKYVITKKNSEQRTIDSFNVDKDTINQQKIESLSDLSFVIPLDLNQLRKESIISRDKDKKVIKLRNGNNYHLNEIEKLNENEKQTDYKQIKANELNQRMLNFLEDKHPDGVHILDSKCSVTYDMQDSLLLEKVSAKKEPEIFVENKLQRNLESNITSHSISSFDNGNNCTPIKKIFQEVKLNESFSESSTNDSFITARESNSFNSACSQLSQMLSPILQFEDSNLILLNSYCSNDISIDSFVSAIPNSFNIDRNIHEIKSFPNNIQQIRHSTVSGKLNRICDAHKEFPVLAHMSAMTGLLILTQPIKKILPRIPQVLSLACEHVTSTLYIHLDPSAVLPYSAPQVSLYDKIITQIYERTSQHCRGVDVRVLMTGFKHQSEVPIKTLIPIELVLFDISHTGNELNKLEQRYKSFLHTNNHIFLQSPQETTSADTQGNEIATESNENSENNTDEILESTIYDDVVVGGTFDRLHAGHKILLSQGLLRCRNRLTSGVSEGPLLKNKTLKELILPTEQRIADLRAFLIDVDPTCEYNLVPITDSLGPTRWDTKMEMIVVSEETKKGVDIINAERKLGGLKPLQGYKINLVEDACRNSNEEEAKVSSSSGRMRLLGTLLRPPTLKDNLPNTPYIIGLTGGTGSGKSSIAKRLEGLGAGVVDCDKMGHEAYMQGTDCYNKLIASFGASIVAEDGSINRRALGPIVFGSKEKLDLLNSIVWPEIAKLTQEKIKNLVSKGKEIIILDAAVLLEAQWDTFCHQVWVCIIKRDEAIRRIVDRDGKSVEDAEKRIDNQMSNEEKIAQGNIVFCTQWAYDYTQLQVEKAWETLKIFMKESKSQL